MTKLCRMFFYLGYMPISLRPYKEDNENISKNYLKMAQFYVGEIISIHIDEIIQKEYVYVRSGT